MELLDQDPYFLEDKSTKEPMAEDDTPEELFGLVQDIQDKWTRAKNARLPIESRMMTAWRNFRGIYGPEVQFTETEKSRAFIKITKTKTLAANAQILDIVFANGTLPITIEPTRLPEGVAETVHLEENPAPEEAPEDNPADNLGNEIGYNGDGKTLEPGFRLLGPLTKRFGALASKLRPGHGVSPEQITLRPADYGAKKMQKTILDQLEESNTAMVIRSMVLEMCMLGTGAIKGPFSVDVTYNKWDKDGQYIPVIKRRPRVEGVSVWNLYPDPDAATIDDAEWVIELHVLTRSQVRQLKKRPYFRSNSIETALEMGPNHDQRWFEQELQDGNINEDFRLYDVLEYWGVIEPKAAKEAGLILPTHLEDRDEIQINAWVCGGEILRLILNPFQPERIPYHVCPYEVNPYQIWGVGVPENMEDCQMVMNGHVRMAIDNLALAGNIVFEIDETNLVPGEDLRIFPGKVFRRNGGPPGQAIFAHKFQSTAQENLAMFDKFRQITDDATGIASVSHGQTGVTGTGRTASGLSMLMGASSLSTKTVIKNLDDFVFTPLGYGFFHWNMQFNPDPEIKGDLEVKARGAHSLMQKEVRSQRLMTLMNVAGNQIFSPFIKIETLLREIADTMDIDPDKFINSPDEAKLQAMIHGMANGPGGQGQPTGGPQSSQPGTDGVGAGTTGSDATGRGAGTIGTGTVANPGEAGFTAATQ